MLIPLWGRAKFSRLYPELLDDPKAVGIIKKVDAVVFFLARRTAKPQVEQADDLEDERLRFIQDGEVCSGEILVIRTRIRWIGGFW